MNRCDRPDVHASRREKNMISGADTYLLKIKILTQATNLQGDSKSALIEHELREWKIRSTGNWLVVADVDTHFTIEVFLTWILGAEGWVEGGGKAWSATSSSGSKTYNTQKPTEVRPK